MAVIRSTAYGQVRKSVGANNYYRRAGVQLVRSKPTFAPGRVFTEAHPPCPGQLLVDAQVSTMESSAPPDADLHQRESKLPTAAPVLKHTYFTVPLDKQVCLLKST